jgi:hypothetical protein
MLTLLGTPSLPHMLSPSCYPPLRTAINIVKTTRYALAHCICASTSAVCEPDVIPAQADWDRFVYCSNDRTGASLICTASHSLSVSPLWFPFGPFRSVEDEERVRKGEEVTKRSRTGARMDLKESAWTVAESCQKVAEGSQKGSNRPGLLGHFGSFWSIRTGPLYILTHFSSFLGTFRS